jgi:hypothetical protein
MMRRLSKFALIAFAFVPAAATPQTTRSVEDIIIARSLRTSRVMPTEFCAERKVGFGQTMNEDRFTFHAVVARRSDGKVTEAGGNTIGHLRACFGVTSNPLKVNFYAEGDLSAVAFTGKGDCEARKADFPERGITIYRCFLELTNLPRAYVGGLLTTNSTVSRQPIGETSDPPGYVQSSVATVRLWKKR